MTTFIDGAGVEWQIDYEGCLQILRQWAQARARMTALRVVTDSSDMQEMRFDADKFRRFRERYYDEEGAAFSARLIADGSDGVRMLAAKYEDIPRLQEQAQARFRRVTSHNMHRVNENVTLGENIVTGLQLTRDISGIIFMCCIPAAAASGGLSLGGAMLARLGGSVFQGVGTWQDTGSAIAGLASANFAFTSSLLSLPPSAGRAAQVVFYMHNTTNTVVRNAALAYLTPGQNTRPFTETLRSQLVQEIGGQGAEALLGAIGGKIATSVLPVLVDASGGSTASAGTLNAALDRIAGTPETLRGDALRSWMEERRQAQNRAAAELAWTQTPFYRFMGSGDRRDLLTSSQQFVNDNLLRPT
ncbi:hypothetical protein [Yoonia sp. SS1-5]|uniref:Uncharacterized protein n=2 Tax=Yoonia rhodophyticola TaxID=3137370 RepID=A0ABZ3JCK9_9RHOB